MGNRLGENSIIRKKPVPKVNLGSMPSNRESSFYSGDERNYLGTGENYKTLGGSFDTKKGSFGAEAWVNKADMSPSLYGTYSKEIKPNLNLDVSAGINDKYFGLGLTKTFVSGAKAVKQYRGDENLPEAKKGMKNCGCKHPKKKYKYGTGAIVIPENSAIVTAKDGKGKRAVEAHLRGDDEEVENIIRKMPADNKYKKADGADVLGLLKNPLAVSQATKRGAQYPWFKPFTSSNTEKGRISSTGQSTLLDPNDVFNQYNNIEALEKKAGRKFTSMEDLQGHIYDNMSDEQRNAMWKKFGPTLKSNEMTRENFIDKLGGARTAYGLGITDKTVSNFKEDNIEDKKTEDKKDDTFAGNKRKGNFLANIPSLAEIAARASILGQGVEKVPENYLSLGRYKYQSQLPKTLQEISLAEQGGRETARNMVGGDAGRYMAQAGSLSASRMKAANEAVIQDTLARQDILNRNVDLGNTEAQVNTGLKNQFAQQRAANRGAYNNQLIALGQGIDTATDASKLMASQRNVDDIRTNLLKSKDYYMDPQGNIRMGKKGIKKVKTYKRK